MNLINFLVQVSLVCTITKTGCEEQIIIMIKRISHNNDKIKQYLAPINTNNYLYKVVGILYSHKPLLPHPIYI